MATVLDEPPFDGTGVGLLEFSYEGEGSIIDGDESLVIEFTDGDLEEVITSVVAVDAIFGQRAELADTDAGFSH